MNIIIRQEKEKDYKSSEKVIEESFKNEEYSDQKEHFLVGKLRISNAFIPELSLVAENNKEIIGYIMLTRIFVENEDNRYESLALAPVAVSPKYQSRGIGSKLINASLKIARELGFKSVIVLGHDKYYPRFGFKPTSTFGIKAPFDIPNEMFMAVELRDNSLTDVKGTVIYNKEFFE